MGSIAFVVNLVPTAEPGWAGRQDLCVRALDAVRAEDVLVLNVCYPEEAAERPGWTTLPVLSRSADAVLGVAGRRKPFVPDLLDAAAAWSAERGADLFCYLNNDIVVAPALVQALRRAAAEGAPALVAARTEAARGPDGLTAGDVLYRGYDVFAFRPDWWLANRDRFQPYILGERAWDNAYAAAILEEPGARLLFERGACLHESHASAWLAGPYADHNMRLYAKADARRQAAFEGFADTLALFGLERLGPADLAELVDIFFRAPIPLQDRRRVNVAMVTHDRLEFTRQAIQGLRRTADFPYSLTVVDNASQDGTPDYLLEQLRAGTVHNLVLLGENLGVSPAANLAWALEPVADYCLKLDNDIVMRRPGWLREMVALAERLPEAGALAYNFEVKSYKRYEFKGARFRLPTAGLGGACLLVPARTKRLVGYWCEEYGLYGEEDADYTARVRLAGLLNCYMEDERAGLHLPAGRAGVIDQACDARDGREEVIHAEYRRWKDDQRRRNLDRLTANYEAYQSRAKSLFAETGVFRRLADRRPPCRMRLRHARLEDFLVRLTGADRIERAP